MTKAYKIILLFLIFCAWPTIARAATLSLVPSTGSHSVGDTFSLTVIVGSADQAMNAASGQISFPADKLVVASVSKDASVISLWVEEPSFSNSDGTVRFEGVVLNPGFIGASGKIITIHFRAKAPGEATIMFTSGSVLANDGQGTNILSEFKKSTFVLKSLSSTAPVEASLSQDEDVDETLSDEGAPIVVSATHPDTSKWYANKNPEFSWKLPNGALEVRTLIGSFPRSVPTISYRPPISSKKVDDLPDGTYYFHLQIRTDEGWGAIAHYRVNIDTTPPKAFTITFPHGNVGAENRPVVLFNTTDDLSGIDYYKVKTGDRDFYTLLPGDIVVSNPHVLPLHTPAVHSIEVLAFDTAGNVSRAQGSFEVVGLKPPQITNVPKELPHGDLLIIEGRTYPNATVVGVLKNAEEEEEEEAKLADGQPTFTNMMGRFTLVWPARLNPGKYTFTAFVVDQNGVTSAETSPIFIHVKSPGVLSFNIFGLQPLLFIGIIVIVLFIVENGMRYVLHRFFGAENKAQKQIECIEQEVNSAMSNMRDEASKGKDINKVSKAAMDSLERMEKILINQDKK
ncbi:MAG: Uncharacterized protein Greene041614_1082 [Parcubacteria group bacterium Greene0416_14]|nr:MAG: Uncharacterized protein Greene041614_1082 [Parcubacteria group bacterium Greene0416_14]